MYNEPRRTIPSDVPSFAVMGLDGCFSVARELEHAGVCLEWVARCEGEDIGHALTKRQAEEICKLYDTMNCIVHFQEYEGVT